MSARLGYAAAALSFAAIAACGATAPSTPPVATTNAATTSSAAPAVAPRCLSIAAWNDMHGQLGPDEVTVDLGLVPTGGVVALPHRIADIRATGDAVVLLDAGDLFTGPLESTLAEGAPIIDAYDVLGVDAAAVGNHEFDFGPVGYDRVTAAPNVGDEAGPDGPRGALFARMESAKFTFLSANIRREDARPLAWPHTRASMRIARDGFDVGVVGYTTTDTPTTTLKPNVVGLTFAKDAAASVAKEIHELRAAGAAPIVLLAHASLEGELPQRLDDPSDPHGDKRTGEIAALLDAMAVADRPDVIVAGHRHAWLLGRVRDVPIVSSDQHGTGLARIRFCRASSGARPSFERIERHVALASSPPTSALGAAVLRAVLPWQDKVRALSDTVVATLAKPCLPSAPDGTALGEQIARAVLERVSDAAPPPPDVPVVAMINSGSVRAPLQRGVVRWRDVFTTTPFENAISVCATTRAGLTRVITNALKKVSVRERLPFAIAGAKVKLERTSDGLLTLERIDVASPRNALGKRGPRDDDPVWLALPDFVLWGGDEYLAGVTCTSTATSQARVRDAWRAVLAREQACDGPAKNVTIERSDRPRR